MTRPDFEELPFSERPDLTPYLIHLTRRSKNATAFENLVNILRTGKLKGSRRSGYIKGPNKAACFMDVPFYSLKHILNKSNTDETTLRYEPYGIFCTKKIAYERGVRPVLYLSNQEVSDLKIPGEELWRVVRFEVDDAGWISWLHEREWRVKGDFKVPTRPYGVLVHTPKEAEELLELLATEPEKFKVRPKSVIPLTVLCQGLVYM
jgi:hypothetical protein